jgi:hypothetical protein
MTTTPITTTTETIKRKRGRPRKGEEPLTVNKLKDYVNKGIISPKTISEQENCSKEVVIRKMSIYLQDQDKLNDFKRNRIDIYLDHIRRLTESITDEQISKMAVRDRYLAAAVLTDKVRNETGSGLANLAGSLVELARLAATRATDRSVIDVTPGVTS